MTEQDDPKSGGMATRLVNELYATVLDPKRYDELLAAWEWHVMDALREIGGGAKSRPVGDDEIEQHFLNAFTLLERLGRPARSGEKLESAIEADPRPALLIASDGRIVTANRPARDLFGVRAGEDVSSFHAAPEGLRQIRGAIRRLETRPPDQVLTIARLFSARDGSAFVVAVCRADMPDGAPPLALLTLADLVWTEHMNVLVRRAFGLSQAECAVLQALIAGDSAAQIAQSRNTSIETVRTQIRAVLRKTEAHSQAELIRMTAALAQFDMTRDSRRMSHGRRMGALFDGFTVHGRNLAYTRIGASEGRPVLFVHGLIDGCSAPLFNQERLKRRNICLVVPTRPGYGGSDPASGGGQAMADLFAADMRALLDHLDIERCPVLGHFGGALYAYAAAGGNPDRIGAVVNVAGTAPITSVAQISAFGPRQRIIAYTSRFAPAVSRLILRAGVALLDKGGHRAFMTALYENSPVDHAVTSRADVFPLLADGYDFSAAQGFSAFEADAIETTRDWSHLVDRVSVPVRLVHGRQDPAMPVSLVRAFAAPRGNIALREIDDAGQLAFFSHPDRVLDILEETLDAA